MTSSSSIERVLGYTQKLTSTTITIMSFLKGLIDKVEGASGSHQHQNAQYSSPHGFNPQQQHGAPWAQQGQLPHNPYQDGYQHREPPASYPYQEGYGRPTYNYEAGPPPPFAHSQPPPFYGNQGQYDMMHRQGSEEHHGGHFPHQFEGREQNHHHNHGYHQEHDRERNHSPGEYKYQHHPEGHGRNHEHDHGHEHQHGHHQEHGRRRSHSRE